MKVSNSRNDSPKEGGNLRNFDLTVDEIKVIRAIRDMTRSLDDFKAKNIQPVRLKFFRNEIKNLEDRLEEIRENTLIR